MTEEFDEDDDFLNENKLPEAVSKYLAKMNARVDSMNRKELMNKLKCFRLDTQGDEVVLRKRLRSSYKKIILASMDLSLSSKLLPYYVVIDFEATCQAVNPPNFRHEIIEFPAVIVNSKKQEIVDSFQMYCKPQINPTISSFCTELTGITQEQVDSAETFETVLTCFQDWLAKHNLGKKHKYGIVTDGPCDMTRFLYSQCHYSNINFPKWARQWINLRKAFSKFYKCERICLKNMLEFLDMEFIGRPHCGLDDAKNIARILLRMIYDGANIQINERITVSKKNLGKIKREDNEEAINGDYVKQDLNNKMQKLRIEAHYTTIYNVEEMPVYKKMRKERLLAEVQLARKILRSPNSTENTS